MPKGRRYCPDRTRAGTPLVAGVADMFGIAPPPVPEPVATPCPHCGATEAVHLYATSRTEYLRCGTCRRIWTVMIEPPDLTAAA
jgi:hypothetical protein